MGRLFTWDEANQLLPLLVGEVDRLQQINYEYKQLHALLNRVKTALPNVSEQVFELEVKIEFMQIEWKTHLSNIERQGVQFKDVEAGLLDFPAIINGEEVLLCWKKGEKEVAFYHGHHDGFKGRKPRQR